MRTSVVIAALAGAVGCGHAEYLANADHAPQLADRCGHAVFQSSAVPGVVNVATHMEAYNRGCGDRIAKEAMADAERAYIQSLQEGAMYYAGAGSEPDAENEDPESALAMKLANTCKGKKPNSPECVQYHHFECGRGNEKACDKLPKEKK